MRHRIAMSPRRADRSAGSVYLIALFVLLALTLIALGLSFVTQTEMMIGANERIIQRTFYAAESGVAMATARILVSHDKSSESILMDDASSTAAEVRTRIDLAPVYPLADPPCEYCQINNDGEYRSRAYRRVNHGVTVQATLVGPNDELVAQKRLSDMIDVQPWPESLPPVDVTDEEKASVEF